DEARGRGRRRHRRLRHGLLRGSRRAPGHAARAPGARLRGLGAESGLRLAALPEPRLRARGLAPRSGALPRAARGAARWLRVPPERRAHLLQHPGAGHRLRGVRGRPAGARPGGGADRRRRGPPAGAADPRGRARGELLPPRRADHHVDRRAGTGGGGAGRGRRGTRGRGRRRPAARGRRGGRRRDGRGAARGRRRGRGRGRLEPWAARRPRHRRADRPRAPAGAGHGPAAAVDRGARLRAARHEAVPAVPGVAVVGRGPVHRGLRGRAGDRDAAAPGPAGERRDPHGVSDGLPGGDRPAPDAGGAARHRARRVRGLPGPPERADEPRVGGQPALHGGHGPGHRRGPAGAVPRGRARLRQRRGADDGSPDRAARPGTGAGDGSLGGALRPRPRADRARGGGAVV
ncbi:MAG: hypothetical protein AVDCRST_MAG79-2726, partial [uncultured Thermoleophilia bacterium]